MSKHDTIHGAWEFLYGSSTIIGLPAPYTLELGPGNIPELEVVVDILGDNGSTLIADTDTLYVPLGAINAKGDLLVGGANDLVNNLPVGERGQLLVVDPTTTSGVVWATPSAVPWSPTSLGAKLTGWLRPEAITENDGTAVVAWTDSSGNGNDTSVATGDNAPSVTAAILNGYRGLDFDGINDWMQWPGISASSTDRTVMAVVDVDSLSQIRTILGGNQTGAVTFRFPATDGTLQLTCPFVADIDTTTATVAINTPAIVGFTLGPSSGEEYINGTVETFTHAVTPTAARTAHLGISILTEIFDGVIYEIAVCSTLTAAERARLDGYLAWKYGLTANLPAGHPYKSRPPIDTPWVLEANATWDVADTATATAATTNVTVTGAAVGDPAVASVSTLGANNWLVSAHVSTTDTVRVVLYNVSGGNLNPASGTVNVKVFKSP